MNLIKITKNVIDNLEFIKKHLFGFLVGVLFMALILFILYQTDIIKFGSADISQTIYIDRPTQIQNTVKMPSCDDGMFAEDLEKWDIKYYDRPDGEGFYCPRSSKDFLYRIIWYESPIATNFQSIELNYQLKNKNINIKDPPSFIFAIEENPGILRFYAPQQKNDQLVGFERIVKDEVEEDSSDISFLMKWEEGKTLNERMAYRQEAVLKVQTTMAGGNKVIFSFTLNYISAIDGRSAENGFSYEVNLPKPSPGSDLSKFKIGFGTFIGNCVKPISYKFCY